MNRPETRQAMSRSLGGATRRFPAWVLSILVLGTLLYAGLFVQAVSGSDYELLQALTIAPVLIGLTVPVALWIARTDQDPTLAGIVMAGVVLKLVGAYVRYYVAIEAYSRSDSRQYDEAGRILAPELRRLVFSDQIGSTVGTGFIKLFTGIVYAVFGMSLPGGFFVFAWLGFLGLLIFTRAFRIGVPTGDPRRYLIAVLFVPTLVYWPSAIGKEAWMMLCIGITAYGVASVFRKRPSGVIALGLGLLAMLMVRPHLTLIVFVGLAFALLVRRAPARTYAAPFFRLVGVVVLALLGLYLASQTAAFLDKPRAPVEGLSVSTIDAQLTNTQDQTNDGGSSFNPVQVNNPLDMAPAFVTVFFRPFPFEASSVQELASAAEGILLIGLLVASRRRLRSIPSLIRTTPYVAFCVGYLLAFTFAFSSFANFGILARQRVQAIPFLLVFLALPLYQDLTNPPASPPPPRAVPEPIPNPASPTRRRGRRPEHPRRTRTSVSSGASFPPPPRTGPSSDDPTATT